MSRATDCNYNDRQLVMPSNSTNIFIKRFELDQQSTRSNSLFLIWLLGQIVESLHNRDKAFLEDITEPRHIWLSYTHIYAEWVPQTLRKKTIPPCPVWSAERIHKTLFNTRFLKISHTIIGLDIIFLQLFLRASTVTFAQLCWHWLSS